MSQRRQHLPPTNVALVRFQFFVYIYIGRQISDSSSFFSFFFCAELETLEEKAADTQRMDSPVLIKFSGRRFIRDTFLCHYCLTQIPWEGKPFKHERFYRIEPTTAFVWPLPNQYSFLLERYASSFSFFLTEAITSILSYTDKTTDVMPYSQVSFKVFHK